MRNISIHIQIILSNKITWNSLLKNFIFIKENQMKAYINWHYYCYLILKLIFIMLLKMLYSKFYAGFKVILQSSLFVKVKMTDHFFMINNILIIKCICYFFP